MISQLSQSLLFLLFCIDNGISGLFVLVPHLLRDSLFGLGLDSLEHWGILEHWGHDDESDLGSSQVDLLNGQGSTIFGKHGDVIEPYVHGVLSISQISSEHFACFHLYCNDMMLGLVQQLDWCSDHFYPNEMLKLVYKSLNDKVNENL